jgi:patatin-related protein
MTSAEGQQAPLTKESVSERLAALTADDLPAIEPTIEAADWAYIEAAAALSSFDPGTLKPLRDVGSHSIAQLLASCVVVSGGTRALHWRLDDAVRREALARLGDRKAILRAYKRNREQVDDELQRAFLAQLRGDAKPLEEQERGELAATLQAAQWLHGIVDDVPDPAVVRRELDRKFLFEPFRFLVGDHFRGRSTELRRLSDYVGVRPTGFRSEKARRGVRKIFRLHERPPLLIYGVGGVGKSTLIAKFILEHAEYVRTDTLAFVYLDFDRATIAAEDPSTLLVEAAQQLACQAESMPERWEDLRVRWLRRLSGEAPRVRRRKLVPSSYSAAGPKASPEAAREMIGEFSEAYDASFRGAPLLLVLDTFEEVQYRSKEFADSLWQFLEDMQSEIPTLRTVIAGRAPVEHFATDDLELTKLDEDAASALLQARGIEDPELARLIASRVGGNPLTLWLAAALAKQAFVDRPSLKSLAADDAIDLLEIERDVTQQTLYTRILRHIHDPNVRRLAHPGLVLRRITSDLIRDVLAEPCGVDVPDDEVAGRLFDAMEREVSLVRLANDGSLEHRRDVRRIMLPALNVSQPAAVAQIHSLAIDFYAARDDSVSRAEEIYHRLASGEDPEVVERERWREDVEDHLRDAVPDLPVRAMVHLAALLRIELDEETWAHASQLDRERRLEASVEDLLTNGRLEDALDALAAEQDRSSGSRLYLLEAMALSMMGRHDESLQTVDVALQSLPALDASPVVVELLSLAADLETKRGNDEGAASRLDAGYRIARSLGKREHLLDLGLRRLQTARRAQADADRIQAIAGELRDDVMETAEDVLRANPELARELSSDLGGAYPEVLRRVAQALSLESSFETGVRELRLGLVCPGGLALAVYTHGFTTEVARLVLGSALLDAGIVSTPTEPAAKVYCDLLYTLEQRAGVRTRVVVDIIAGTSACGINGLVLAKALAHNLSGDALRDFWLEGSEILRPKRGLAAWLALVRTLWNESFETLRRQLGLAERSSRRHRLDPLGAAVAGTLFDALQAMDARGPALPSLSSLVAHGHVLEASIPVTDIDGYDSVLPLASPRTTHARRHSHTLTFRYETGGRDDFRAIDNGSLAFAALTTLAPADGARAVTLEAFEASLPQADLSHVREQVARVYALGEDDAESARFVDGGHLETKPFKWLAEAIKRRRPDVEVERRILYVASSGAHRDSGPIATAFSGVAREESIAKELRAAGVHNDRVTRVRDVIETSYTAVAELVESTVGGSFPDDPAQLRRALGTIEKRTIAETGVAYTAYMRLRIRGAVGRYARTFCDVCGFPPDSSQADLVRAVIQAWAAERGLFDPTLTPSESQRDFLGELDLGYRARRPRFVEAGMRWWHRDFRQGREAMPPRAELDQAKMLLHDAVDHVRRTMGGSGFDDELRDRVRRCFPKAEVRDFLAERGFDPLVYLEAHRAELEAAEQDERAFIRSRLHGFDERLFGDMSALSAEWHPDRRRAVFVRYLGFPLWDVLLYPIQAFGYFGENDFFRIERVSTDDARVLSTTPAEKLKVRPGDVLSDRSGRESEYLWGRLDGAEQLVAIILGRDHPDYDSWCMRAFAAILDEDAGALPHILDTVRALKSQVAR